MKWFVVGCYAVINFTLAVGVTTNYPYVQIAFIAISTILYVFYTLKYASFPKVSIIDLEDAARTLTTDMHLWLTGLYFMTIYRMVADLSYYMNEAPQWMGIACVVCFGCVCYALPRYRV